MGYAPIKTDRGVIGWLLLSIVTCGIYSYYFLYGSVRPELTSCPVIFTNCKIFAPLLD